MKNIEIRWDDAEKTILLVDFVDKWTWDDFHTAVMQSYNMAKSVPHRVDIISNASSGIPLPTTSAFSHFSHVTNSKPKNVVCIVLVTQNRFLHTINKVFFSVNKKAAETSAIASTVEEARKVIAYKRAIAALKS